MDRVRITNKAQGTELLRKAAVARKLGRSSWTLDRWIRQGLFPRPFYLVPGGPAMWRPQDVEAFIEKRRRARNAKPPVRGKLKQYQPSSDEKERPRSRA